MESNPLGLHFFLLNSVYKIDALIQTIDETK